MRPPGVASGSYLRGKSVKYFRLTPAAMAVLECRQHENGVQKHLQTSFFDICQCFRSFLKSPDGSSQC